MLSCISNRKPRDESCWHEKVRPRENAGLEVPVSTGAARIGQRPCPCRVPARNAGLPVTGVTDAPLPLTSVTGSPAFRTASHTNRAAGTKKSGLGKNPGPDSPVRTSCRAPRPSDCGIPGRSCRIAAARPHPPAPNDPAPPLPSSCAKCRTTCDRSDGCTTPVDIRHR